MLSSARDVLCTDLVAKQTEFPTSYFTIEKKGPFQGHTISEERNVRPLLLLLFFYFGKRVPFVTLVFSENFQL
jgi:hypothetical protein